MEKYGFVYLWRDKKHNRYYIGSHWGTEDDRYVCSSRWMMKSYKRRPEDFKRRILSRVYTNKKDLLQKENEWLSLIKEEELKTRYYNLMIHEFGHWSTDKDLSLSVSQRISVATKEAMYRPEVRKKYIEGLKDRNNRSSELEVREKRRKSMIGKNVGKDMTKCREALVSKLTGSTLSEEHKQKIKEAGVFKGMNSKRISCMHCGKEGNPGNIGRYHNNNCKTR